MDAKTICDLVREHNIGALYKILDTSLDQVLSLEWSVFAKREIQWNIMNYILIYIECYNVSDDIVRAYLRATVAIGCPRPMAVPQYARLVAQHYIDHHYVSRDDEIFSVIVGLLASDSWILIIKLSRAYRMCGILDDMRAIDVDEFYYLESDRQHRARANYKYLTHKYIILHKFNAWCVRLREIRTILYESMPDAAADVFEMLVCA